MDAGGDRPLYSSNVAVIREIYDSEYAPQTFALELERALDAECSIIVIEPTQLGEETARWIYMGNCLHKTAVVSGLGAILTGLIWSDKPIVCVPFGVVSLLCTGFYTISWQFDNCVKYQEERDPKRLSKLQVVTAMSAALPVVLVRKDDTRRKIVHCTVSLAAAAFCAYKLYDTLK
ncbi:hypothetical protein PPYR_01673 [Photinus pyralis]|uniref:Transmembrane protein 11 n=1 Tax=Photinus pyralis TaxID=7054 RepID=A0A5N4B583_PHOPY|nr:transmembrane protein 11-B, mitochondrial [Photinus pyralis]KAB0804703.1 hypothetical protein PPYR_01673 [Photinus pyralis]